MLCDLCGRPEESHVCTADVTKLMAENAKLRAEVERTETYAEDRDNDAKGMTRLCERYREELTNLKKGTAHIADCHDRDMKHLVERTMERDKLLLQNGELSKDRDKWKGLAQKYGEHALDEIHKVLSPMGGLCEEHKKASSDVKIPCPLCVDRLIDEMEKDYEIARRGLSFILHGASSSEEMYAAANDAMAKMRPCGGFAEKRNHEVEPRYCVKCGRRMEAADAAHPYTCEGKGDAANPAPFIH